MKIIYKNEIREAKRYKDCSPESVKYSSENYSWEEEAIFMKPKSELIEWIYVYDNEVEIISE